MRDAELMKPIENWPEAPPSHIPQGIRKDRAKVNPWFIEWAAARLASLRFSGDYETADALRAELERRNFNVSYVPVGVIKGVCVVDIWPDEQKVAEQQWTEFLLRARERAAESAGEWERENARKRERARARREELKRASA